MTPAKRLSISLLAELEQTVVNLRRTERFCRCRYADIIRQMIVAGVKAVAESNDNNDPLGASVKQYADNNALVDNYNYLPDDHYSVMGAEMQKYEGMNVVPRQQLGKDGGTASAKVDIRVGKKLKLHGLSPFVLCASDQLFFFRLNDTVFPIFKRFILTIKLSSHPIVYQAAKKLQAFSENGRKVTAQ